MSYDFDVYGTALEPHPDDRNDLRTLSDVAVRAQRYGFEGLLSFYNHRNLDPWVVASALLQSTSTLVPLVALQPYAVPPFTAAKMVHTLSTLYGRRIDLNLITGAAKQELEQIGDTVAHDDRYERAIEYATVVRKLLTSNDALTFEGRFFTFRDLVTGARLAPELQPRIFVAGASEAGRRCAEAVGDVSVTHPEPLKQFAENFLAARADGPEVAIRIGLLARPTSDEAWEIAHERYAGDRTSRIKTAMRRKSDSEWSRRLATLATEAETYDDVYFTGAYRSDKGSAPIFVGSYDEVAGYLARYLDLGIRKVLLGSVYDEQDFAHVDGVLSRLRA